MLQHLCPSFWHLVHHHSQCLLLGRAVHRSHLDDPHKNSRLLLLDLESVLLLRIGDGLGLPWTITSLGLRGGLRGGPTTLSLAVPSLLAWLNTDVPAFGPTIGFAFDDVFGATSASTDSCFPFGGVLAAEFDLAFGFNGATTGGGSAGFALGPTILIFAQCLP